MAAAWGRSTALLDVLPQHHRAVLEESLERQRREVAQVGAVLGAVLRGDGVALRAALGDLHPCAACRSTALVLVAKLFEELRLLSSERYLAGLDTSASALPPYLELLLPRFPPPPPLPSTPVSACCGWRSVPRRFGVRLLEGDIFAGPAA